MRVRFEEEEYFVMAMFEKGKQYAEENGAVHGSGVLTDGSGNL